MYKLLIAEDNRRDREGLLKFLNWDTLGIDVLGCACNGLEGRAMAEEIRPHIIITDIMMPKMDGIQMSREIRSFLPDSKIILLSGYDDFQYAKQSFEFHAFAYLLKPVQKDLLVDTLQKALKALCQEDSRKTEVRLLENRWIEFVQGNQKSLLLDFLECKVESKHIYEVISANEMRKNAKMVVAILNLFPGAAIKNIHGGAASTAQHEYLQKVEYLLAKKGRMLLHSKPLKEVVLCIESPPAQRELEAQMLEITNTLRNSMDVESIIGMGDIVDSLADAPQSYMQAREAISYSSLADYGALLSYHALKEENQRLWDTAAPLLLKANGIIEELIHCVQKGRIHDGIDLADGFLTTLKTQCFSSKMVLSSFIISVLKGLGLLLPDFNSQCNSQWDQRNHDLLGLEFLEPESFQHTRQYVLGILSDYAAVEKANGCHEDAARRIIEIIETSYAEDLDLKRMAQEIYLSPYYIGSIFKRFTGKAFRQYLYEYRVRKAKEILQTQDVKLHELARSVGIHNQSYFSELFKQTYGLSPGAYRELMKGMQESV